MSDQAVDDKVPLQDFTEGELVQEAVYQQFVDNVLQAIEGVALLMTNVFGFDPHVDRHPGNDLYASFRRLLDLRAYFRVARVIGQSIVNADGTIRISRDFICSLMITTDHLVTAMSAIQAKDNAAKSAASAPS